MGKYCSFFLLIYCYSLFVSSMSLSLSFSVLSLFCLFFLLSLCFSSFHSSLLSFLFIFSFPRVFLLYFYTVLFLSSLTFFYISSLPFLLSSSFSLSSLLPSILTCFFPFYNQLSVFKMTKQCTLLP